jgi:hypothetical protein
MRLSLGNGAKLGTGLVIGVAAVLLAPVVLPAAAGIVRSLTKAGIKGGLIMYEKGKLAVAEAKESLEDMAAEAKAELDEEKQETAASAKKKKAASTAKS